MINKFLIRLFICSISYLFIISCSNNEAEKKDELKETSVLSDSSKPAEEVNTISYTLPSPMQISGLLKKAGLRYYSGLTNPLENYNTYISENTVSKTIALGIYLSDLSYCILNKQNQSSKNYFKICTQLSESLGLAQAFQDNNVPERIEKNLENSDSITKIMAEIQMESDNLLEENKQAYISVVAFSGAWIECMYIGTKVHEKEKNANVARHIVEQMGIAENIIKALNVCNTKKSDIEKLLQDMNDLNNIYTNFKSVREAKESDPDVIDPASLKITVDELLRFSTKIEEIRNRLIKA